MHEGGLRYIKSYIPVIACTNEISHSLSLSLGYQHCLKDPQANVSLLGNGSSAVGATVWASGAHSCMGLVLIGMSYFHLPSGLSA